MKQQKLLAALLCAASPLACAANSDPFGEIVVTASRFGDAPENAPVDVTVINAEDIRNSTAKTLPALLAQHAGIQVRSTDGTPNMMVDLRGFGMTGNQNTLVLLDGQPLNDIELTSIPWSSIPLDSIARIEIVNGSGAVLYGGGASGGTINIITKKPGKGAEAALSAGLGSYGAREWNASFGARGEHTGLRISADTQQTDSYRANNAFAQSSLEGEARTDAGRGDIVLKFGADSQNLRLPGARRVDPSIGLDQPENDPRGATTPLDYANQQGEHISLGTSQPFDFGEFAAELGYRDDKQQAYYDAFGGSYLDTDLNLLSFTPRLKITRPLGGSANELVVGADFADWDYDSLRSTNPATLSTPAAHILARQQNRALYAQDTAQLGDDTRLTLGVRTQHTAYRANDAVNPAAYAAADRGYNVSVYEIGLRRTLSPAWSLFGRIGRSFRMATVDEIYDQFGGPLFDSSITMLRPQKSQDGEIGLDYADGKTKMRASLYNMNLNDEIHYNAVTFTNMNLSPTHRYGLELEGSHTWADSFETHAAYSYTVAKFREGIYAGVNLAGNNIPLVPRQRLSLAATWSLAEKTALSASALYVGRQHFDNDQANAFGQLMPAYTTADLKLSRQSGPWSLSAAVNNLFNEKYFTYAVASTFSPGVYNAYPMPERNFFVSAQYRY